MRAIRAPTTRPRKRPRATAPAGKLLEDASATWVVFESKVGTTTGGVVDVGAGAKDEEVDGGRLVSLFIEQKLP